MFLFAELPTVVCCHQTLLSLLLLFCFCFGGASLFTKQMHRQEQQTTKTKHVVYVQVLFTPAILCLPVPCGTYFVYFSYFFITFERKKKYVSILYLVIVVLQFIWKLFFFIFCYYFVKENTQMIIFGYLFTKVIISSFLQGNKKYFVVSLKWHKLALNSENKPSYAKEWTFGKQWKNNFFSRLTSVGRVYCLPNARSRNTHGYPTGETFIIRILYRWDFYY